MARNLLQIVQAACDELGIQSPSSVAGSQDQQVRQLLALANREGAELAAMAGTNGGWPQLRKEQTFNLVAGTDNYALPTDWGFYLNGTVWDRTSRWQLLGPLSPQEWQVVKSGISPTGPRFRFRIMANRFYFDPVPAVTDQIAIEYISENWCTDSSGVTAKALFTSDGDLPLLPDDAFILGLKWRFRSAKGLDYDEEYEQYTAFVDKELARSGMARSLSLSARQPSIRLLNGDNVPDTNFGQ